jgi:hypothetical protein
MPLGSIWIMRKLDFRGSTAQPYARLTVCEEPNGSNGFASFFFGSIHSNAHRKGAHLICCAGNGSSTSASPVRSCTSGRLFRNECNRFGFVRLFLVLRHNDLASGRPNETCCLNV